MRVHFETGHTAGDLRAHIEFAPIGAIVENNGRWNHIGGILIIWTLPIEIDYPVDDVIGDSPSNLPPIYGKGWSGHNCA